MEGRGVELDRLAEIGLRLLTRLPRRKRLARAERLTPVRTAANYSYASSRQTGPGFALVGDAFTFIDPVFSSGVTLALTSAKEATTLLTKALEEGREADPDLMKPIHEATALGYETFAALVHRFYNTKIVDNLIFGAPADGELRPSVVSVLGGDVFRPDNPFRDMLLNSRATPWRDEEKADVASEEAMLEKVQ